MLAMIRRLRAPLVWPTLAALCVYLSGCAYREKDVPPDQPLMLEQGKVLVLNYGGAAWPLNAPRITQEGLRATAADTGGGLSKGQRINLYIAAGGTVKMGDSLWHSGNPKGKEIFIPWQSVSRISVYDFNAGKTLAVWTVSLLGAAAIVGIIILATKNSCPFVYSGDGSGFSLVGEIFSGAIYPSLERDDYLPLPPAMPGEPHRIRITNEVKEIQHINTAELWMAGHAQGTEVLLDDQGRPRTFSHPISPASCRTLAGADVLPEVLRKDSLAYIGGERGAKDAAGDGLTLAFKRPPGAREAKLVLRAKNSFWLDYLYGRFLDLFGEKMSDWNRQMRVAPKQKLEEWFREQKLPLLVETRAGGNWKEVKALPLVGPMALRDLIVPMTLDTTSDSVRVRLSSGFLFWEIDYAAMDFSADQPVTIRKIAAHSAVDQHGRDLRADLASGDGLYYDQPSVGDAAELTFDAPRTGDTVWSAFLFSRGHYEILRETKGPARTAALSRFRQSGALGDFSREQLEKMQRGGALEK